MNKTGISWTDYTWNPVSGCSKVSPGCQNCYAEALAHRWGRSFDVTLHPQKLKDVRKIPSGSKVFVNSMSDLFHENVPFPFIWNVMKAIASRPDVIFQILTKRPERIVKYYSYMVNVTGVEYGGVHPTFAIPNNVWLGVSVEMALYKKRIGILAALNQNSIHSGHTFVSFEPLLGDIGEVDLSGISWSIIGGESGPHHRPMNIEWARNLVRQAKEQGVAVWMKQLGGIRPGGNLEDFPEDLRIREFPASLTKPKKIKPKLPGRF